MYGYEMATFIYIFFANENTFIYRIFWAMKKNPVFFFFTLLYFTLFDP